jgi:hypothetical protein
MSNFSCPRLNGKLPETQTRFFRPARELRCLSLGTTEGFAKAYYIRGEIVQHVEFVAKPVERDAVLRAELLEEL